jgi:hypothetical protein
MDDQPRDFAQFKLMAEIGGRYCCLGGAPGEKWLSYHLQHFPPPTSFGGSLLKALAVCEEHIPNLGMKLAEEMAAIPFHRERAEYEQLIQKLAEVLVLRVLLEAVWPPGTSFKHEPQAPNGRRPELAVETPDQIFLFEVKCPALIKHQFARAENSSQLPTRARSSDSRALSSSIFNGEVTLPKDNTLRDYLESAQSKFESFQHSKPVFAALVVLWDSHVYEAIAPLIHKQCGLLTPASWHKDKNGYRVPFDAVDGVLILNHLGVLIAATREEALAHRADPFSLRDDVVQKNAWCTNPGGQSLPDALCAALDARPIEALAHLAEYGSLDLVFWTTVP